MPNIYELSDEELANADLSQLASNEEPEQSEQETEETPETETTQTNESQVEETINSEEESDNTDNPSDEEIVNQPTNQKKPKEQTPVEETETEETETTPDKEEDKPSEPQVDYESFYKVLTAPFKANGKEIQITNPEDAIALMQQGANYSKRMAALKPSMGILKTLEQNGLTDESKLSYLIDLNNKKPEAIAKLIKDSEIDLYSFDTEQADKYVPESKVQTYSDLEEIMADLQTNSPTFNTVLSNVLNTWDEGSKEILAKRPDLLKVLDAQAQAGIYDKIVNAIEYERMLGRMNNMSFLDAYRTIEAQMANAQQNSVSNPTATQPVQQSQQVQPFTAPRPTEAAKPVSNGEQKKRATAPTNTGKVATQEDFNPLAISDEELLKYMNQSQYH